ncbi:transcription initiation factor TFIID subunit 3 [Trichogramma pretiosum]|uniref:transcription initiation factor TFIID subunit 3 n=1 Tax=Trichogramma pretiosum TaxID=7493 RepID=UPI0006C9C58C|nr:transcription initiation factor TFIID subunit 3 [Trichogramma pretiosum]XP_023314395.1 transcription initiation factor TFIID subunit 3 [Trichogramma pretiosum]
MTSEYTRSVLKVVVAQIAQNVGWHSTLSTPLEFLVDLLQEYMYQVSKVTSQYATALGRNEVNLDDLGLAFQQLNVDVGELEEYVKNIKSVPCAISVPKLPVARENHLNFLKPGSREVVTRPRHVHEHLPAMYPQDEEEYEQENKELDAEKMSNASESVDLSEDDGAENNTSITKNGTASDDSLNKASPQGIFKRPGDPSILESPSSKRIKKSGDGGRPLREIRSVMMTTSGFLSTAREGKLPESRTPHQEQVEEPVEGDEVDEPCEDDPPIVAAPEIKVEKKLKRIPKKLSEQLENVKPEIKDTKKKRIPKESTLFKPKLHADEVSDSKVSTKDFIKPKAIKSNARAAPVVPGCSNAGIDLSESARNLKNFMQANFIKTDKNFDEEINKSNKFDSLNGCKDEVVDKLPIKPNKQKLNILKKISKPKEERDVSPSFVRPKVEPRSRDSSPLSTVSSIKEEDRKGSLLNNSMLHDNVPSKTGSETDSDGCVHENPSLPSPPSTPKSSDLSVSNTSTPILNHNTPSNKRKKKEKSEKKKKIPKIKTALNSKKMRVSTDFMGNPDLLDRPKTPQVSDVSSAVSNAAIIAAAAKGAIPPTMPFPFFQPTAPGLIPQPVFPLMMGPPNTAAMPGMLNNMRPRFFRPPLQHNTPLMHQEPGVSSIRISNSGDRMETKAPFSTSHTPQTPIPSINNSATVPAPLVPASSVLISPNVPAPLLPPDLSTPGSSKSLKLDKMEKKSKEHKKEKKDKMKKKKEKKEKHKDKGEKEKVKKDKSDKRDKLEKIKEKKEKKEKKKEKEALKKLREDKMSEGVPKITLKLGPAGGSPRPPTPDSALTKKITIKPPKKPEEEVKNEPAPELARISALVTRPPKQKSSKRMEDEITYTGLADACFSSTNHTPMTHMKKPIFKALPVREPSPSKSFPTFNTSYSNSSYETQKNTEFRYTDQTTGLTVWICPGCKKQDDGSPMIGCDDCDAWYHWTCVNIQIAPAENENWYCKPCIVKKQATYNDKKKKKRKKKKLDD